MRGAAGRDHWAWDPARLRAEAGRRPDDRDLSALIGELSSRSPQFAALWAHPQRPMAHHGVQAVPPPSRGDLELDYEAMEVAGNPGHTQAENAGALR